jgi:hypothetical protein
MKAGIAQSMPPALSTSVMPRRVSPSPFDIAHGVSRAARLARRPATHRLARRRSCPSVKLMASKVTYAQSAEAPNCPRRPAALRAAMPRSRRCAKSPAPRASFSCHSKQNLGHGGWDGRLQAANLRPSTSRRLVGTFRVERHLAEHVRQPGCLEGLTTSGICVDPDQSTFGR